MLVVVTMLDRYMDKLLVKHLIRNDPPDLFTATQLHTGDESK